MLTRPLACTGDPYDHPPSTSKRTGIEPCSCAFQNNCRSALIREVSKGLNDSGWTQQSRSKRNQRIPHCRSPDDGASGSEALRHQALISRASSAQVARVHKELSQSQSHIPSLGLGHSISSAAKVPAASLRYTIFPSHRQPDACLAELRHQSPEMCAASRVFKLRGIFATAAFQSFSLFP